MKKQLILFIAVIFVLAGCSNANNIKNKQSNKLNNNQMQETTKDVENTQKVQDTSRGNNTKNKKETTSQEKNKNITVNKDDFKNLVDSNTHAIIETNLGNIKVKFYNEDARNTVNNFLNLANLDFYNGTIFHRVIKDFMIQAGDPLSRDKNWAIHGTGGPGYSFKDEFNDHKLVKGSLAMANSGPNTNGSQFFIVTADATPWLDGKHTNFGEVIEGMDVVEKIEQVETNERDHPLKDIVIKDIKVLK